MTTIQELKEYHWCNEHGRTTVVEEHCVDGFTGAPIWFTDLACDCQLIDDSQDTLEWVK